MTPKTRDEESETVEKTEKKKKKRKPLLFVLIPVLLLVIGGLAFVFLGDSLPFISSGSEDSADTVDGPPRHLYAMSEFQVNLADPGTRRFLRMKIDLAYDERALTREIEERESELRSHIIAILRSKFVIDLEEPGGMKELERDLLDQLNSVLDKGQIEAIYYKEFIFQ